MIRARIREIKVRGHAEHLGGTRVRFFCPHGHSQTEDMGRKSLPISKRLSENAVRLVVRHWQPGTGVTFVCKACTKLAAEC